MRRFGIAGLRVFGPAIFVLASLISGAASAQVPDLPPDRVLTGHITIEDHETYKRIPFELPEGTERLVVAFDYDHREVKTVIDLGIEDMHGFRGASGGAKSSFTISRSDATPSYVSGRLEPGEWALNLGIPNIRSGVRAEWTARLWFLSGASAQTLASPTEGMGPGWYRGDLHVHTGHSDASCASRYAGMRRPCPLFRTLEAAVENGLDFIVVTEHNTISQAAALREAQPYFDDLLLIPGQEITTFRGHFTIWGITEPIDYRITAGGINSFNRIADRVHELGGLVSISHPNLPSGEICMGCGWTMPDVDYSKADAVETVMGLSERVAAGDALDPLSGVGFWLDRLMENYRLTAVGITDNHDPDKTGLGGIGLPTTVVEAADLSPEAIFEGIRNGRVFVSLTEDRDLRLDFSASDRRQAARMGGNLETSDKKITLAFEIEHAPPGSQIALYDGHDLLEILELDVTPLTVIELSRGKHVLWPQLRGEDGRTLALGNPILVEVKKR